MPVTRAPRVATWVTPGVALAVALALAVLGALAARAATAPAPVPARADTTRAGSSHADSTHADSSHARAVPAAAPADSLHAHADSTRADSLARLEPHTPGPPSGTPPPLKTRTKRGGPYNVVADRLEGGRTAAEG